MSDLSAADIKSLKAKNIIYMDQIVSSDGNYLLSWSDVKRNNNNNYSGPIPAWYKNLTDNYVLSNNLRLIHPLNDVVCDINRTHKSPPTIPDVTTPKSQWTIHWNNVQKQVIFGKTLTQETDCLTSISYLQHFIPQQTHHNNSLTPKKQLLGLVACKGCLLHSYYPHDARPTCVIAIRTQKLLLFNIFKKSSFEHKSLLEFYNRQNFVVATKPFHTLRYIAYEHFIKIDKSPLNTSSQRSLDAVFTPYPSLPSNNIDNHIDHALICHPDLKVELKSCAKQLELENLLTFYTDGSVQHIGTIHSISGYGWTQVQPLTPRVNFSGSTVFFPSSSKSESMGILTALIVSPFNCKINVYTDSANCITIFNTRMQSGVASPRQKLKQSNFLIWDLIFFLIEEKQLLVTLYKVSGHSNNPYNDEADLLAKAGAHFVEPIIVNHKFFVKQSLGFISWNRLHVVDRNVRKWADNVIQPLIFNSMVNNKALSPIKQQIIDGDIDWSFTKEWLNSNDQDVACSAKLSKQQGNRIKKCNFIYPTIDIQQRNYPRLYPLGSIPCIECASARDDNTHVGLCKEHSLHIKNILIRAAHDLHEFIIKNTKDGNSTLKDTITNLSLFNTSFVDALPQSHPGYLLIHHLVPSDLVKIFNIYINDKKLRFSLFSKFFSTLMSSIDTLIWTRRASLVKHWESTLSITKNKKRFYRKRHKKRAPPSPDPGAPVHNLSPRRYYNPRHFTTTPYYRDGGFNDNLAHIRWTTSNYLHSGHWTTYRDNIGFNNIDLFLTLQNSFLKNVFDII
ncbi:hypothetical protein RhiirA1_458847 [Rhizophagus irregularis]|uniref:RNase H type-1 domain-containing protein n=1 Tax=Rhizophagus irregularis TaxID=588596 RepID=A0A2N0RUW3_9GLOM|nr:hypothetical protein RhiirA1_458847 [Rhizophagus irregularis]